MAASTTKKKRKSRLLKELEDHLVLSDGEEDEEDVEDDGTIVVGVEEQEQEIQPPPNKKSKQQQRKPRWMKDLEDHNELPELDSSSSSDEDEDADAEEDEDNTVSNTKLVTVELQRQQATSSGSRFRRRRDSHNKTQQSGVDDDAKQKKKKKDNSPKKEDMETKEATKKEQEEGKVKKTKQIPHRKKKATNRMENTTNSSKLEKPRSSRSNEVGNSKKKKKKNGKKRKDTTTAGTTPTIDATAATATEIMINVDDGNDSTSSKHTTTSNQTEEHDEEVVTTKGPVPKKAKKMITPTTMAIAPSSFLETEKKKEKTATIPSGSNMHTTSTSTTTTAIPSQKDYTNNANTVMYNNNEDNNKKETQSERQARLKAEALAFAFSGVSAKDVRELEMEKKGSSSNSYSNNYVNSILYGTFWKALTAGDVLGVQKCLEQIQHEDDECSARSGSSSPSTFHDYVLNSPRPKFNNSSSNIDGVVNHGMGCYDDDDVDDTDDYDYETPLFVATNNGHLDMVEYLLRQPNIDVNTDRAGGRPSTSAATTTTALYVQRPLSAACRNGNAAITKLLLDAGADPTIVMDTKGKTPLHEACSQGSVDIAKLILDSNNNNCGCCVPRNINHTTNKAAVLLVNNTDNHGFTPLHSAIWGEHHSRYLHGEILLRRKEDTVNLLLDRGANIDAQDTEGETALHLALLDIVTLQQNNNNINSSNDDINNNLTTTATIMSHSTSPLVELLLRRGANKITEDVNGNSFYHKYARNEKLRITHNQLLLSGTDFMHAYRSDNGGILGCPLRRKNKAGKTPLDLAKEYGQVDLVDLFESYISKLDSHVFKKTTLPAPGVADSSPTKNGQYSINEHKRFIEGIRVHGFDWDKVSNFVGTRNAKQVHRYAYKSYLVRKLYSYHPIKEDDDVVGNWTAEEYEILKRIAPASWSELPSRGTKVFFKSPLPVKRTEYKRSSNNSVDSINSNNDTNSNNPFLFNLNFNSQRLGFVLTTGDHEDVIISDVQNSVFKNHINVGDKIVAINGKCVAKQPICFVSKLLSNLKRPVKITFSRQEYQHHHNQGLVDIDSGTTCPTSTIGGLSTTTHNDTAGSVSQSSSSSSEEEILHDIVFYTQQLGLHLGQTKSGETVVKANVNDEYKNDIFVGDIVTSVAGVSVVGKSMQDVVSLVKEVERPVTIQFVRPTDYYWQRQHENRDCGIDQQKQPPQLQNKQTTTALAGEGTCSRSLRDIITTLSPDILSGSIHSDNDNDNNQITNQNEKNARLPSLLRLVDYDNPVTRRLNNSDDNNNSNNQERQVRLKAKPISKVLARNHQVVDFEAKETTQKRCQNPKYRFFCPRCNKGFKSEGGLSYHVEKKVCLVKSLRTSKGALVSTIDATTKQSKDATNLKSSTGVFVPKNKAIPFPQNIVPPLNDANIGEETTNKNHLRHASSLSNDNTKKSENEPDRPLQAVSIAHISQQSVVSDIHNVVHTSGYTTTKMVATSEDSSEPAAGGSKFDMFPDAALNEKEEEEFPLHSCVKFGFLDFLEEELQKETTVVNAIDSRGRTALDLAALTGQLTLVTRLRNAGGIFQYKNGPRMLALANNRSKEMDKYLKCVRNSVG